MIVGVVASEHFVNKKNETIATEEQQIRQGEYAISMLFLNLLTWKIYWCFI